MNEQRGNRATGRVVDCDKLARIEPALFIHRFVDAIWAAREERKRYLYLRAGDEIAIAVVGDGSQEILDSITASAETPET